MSTGSTLATPNIREVWGLVRARTKEELRRIAVALVPPGAPGVRAYFADGSQRDYRYVGELLEEVPGGFESWPPPPSTSTPMRVEPCNRPTVNARPLTGRAG